MLEGDRRDRVQQGEEAAGVLGKSAQSGWERTLEKGSFQQKLEGDEEVKLASTCRERLSSRTFTERWKATWRDRGDLRTRGSLSLTVLQAAAKSYSKHYRAASC